MESARTGKLFLFALEYSAGFLTRQGRQVAALELTETRFPRAGAAFSLFDHASDIMASLNIRRV
jgi:hypothetical protein